MSHNREFYCNDDDRTYQQHKALPWGGFRLLCWFGWQALTFCYLWPAGWQAISQASGFSAAGYFLLYAFATPLVYLTGGGLLLSVNGRVEPWKEPFRFLGHWLRRNFVGYHVHFNGNGMAGIHLRRDSCSSRRSVGYFVCIPLGGWFNRGGKVLYYAKDLPPTHGGLEYQVLFNVSLRKNRFLLGSAHVDVWDSPSSYAHGVRWTDVQARSLVQRLNFYDQVRPVNPVLRPSLMLEEALGGMFFVAGSFRSDAEGLQLSVNSVHAERNKLLQLGVETVTRLDETKRFIKSKEAMAIREWLAGELRQYVIDDARQQLLRTGHVTNY